MFRVGRARGFAIHAPQVAHRGHFHIVVAADLRHDIVQFRAAAPDPDVPKRDPLI